MNNLKNQTNQNSNKCFDGNLFWKRFLDLYSSDPTKTLCDCLEQTGAELNVPEGFTRSLMLQEDIDIIKHVDNFLNNIFGNTNRLNDAIAKRRELMATV